MTVIGPSSARGRAQSKVGGWRTLDGLLEIGTKIKIFTHKAIRGIAVAGSNGVTFASHQITDLGIQGLVKMV